MAKDIDINVQDAIWQLKREFRNLSGSQFNLSIARAINHTLNKANTVAKKDVRSEYKVKNKDIAKAFVKIKANRTNLTAYIRVSARPLPIVAFGARQNSKGVSVNITGKRQTIKSAFLATMKSGHRGVFVRGRYKGTELTYRTKRINKTGPDLPIEEVHTASPFSMVTNQRVQQRVAEKVQQDFSMRLLHELKRMSQGSR